MSGAKKYVSMMIDLSHGKISNVSISLGFSKPFLAKSAKLSSFVYKETLWQKNSNQSSFSREPQDLA